MDELNGQMIARQILITGLIARVANDSPDPSRVPSGLRDEIKASQPLQEIPNLSALLVVL